MAWLYSQHAVHLWATSCEHPGTRSRCPSIAGFPFIVLNTVCGSLAAYGFAGLRYTPRAIILFQVMLVLQSLAAVQLLILCVYATPTQACASSSSFSCCIDHALI